MAQATMFDIRQTGMCVLLRDTLSSRKAFLKKLICYSEVSMISFVFCLLLLIFIISIDKL